MEGSLEQTLFSILESKFRHMKQTVDNTLLPYTCSAATACRMNSLQSLVRLKNFALSLCTSLPRRKHEYQSARRYAATTMTTKYRFHLRLDFRVIQEKL